MRRANETPATDQAKPLQDAAQNHQRRRKRVRREGDAPASRAMRVVDGATLTLVALAPLLLGGVPALVQLALVAAIFGLFALTVLHAHLHKHAWRWHPISVVMVLLGLWSLFQASPLSGPLAARWTRDAFALWELSPRVAIAPGRVALSAATWMAYGALVQLWVIRFPSSRHAKRAVMAVLVGGATTLAIGLAQELRGATTIFGYTPAIGRVLNPLAGPFVNANQAGAMLALTLILALGSATRAQRRERLVVAAIFVLVGSGLLWSGLAARGALLGLVAGAGVLVVGQLLSPSRELRLLGPRLMAATLLTLTGLIALLTTGHAQALRPWLDATTAGKLTLWHETSRLVAAAPVAGYGPGGFPDVYPNVATTPWSARYAFVESGPLQLAVDFGLPLAMLLIATLVYALWRWFARRGVPDRDTALVALAVATTVGVEATLGMGLAAPGYAIPVVALVGVVAARTSRPLDTYQWRAPVGALVLLGVAMSTIPALPTALRLGHQGLDGPLTGVASTEAEAPSRALAHEVPADFALIVNATWHAIQREDPWSEEASTYLITHAPQQPLSWYMRFLTAYARGEMDVACAALTEQSALGTTTREVSFLLTQPDADYRQWQRCLTDGPARAELYRLLLGQSRYAATLAASNDWLRTAPTDLPALDAALRASVALEMGPLATGYAVALLEQPDVSPEMAVRAIRALREAQAFASALRYVDALLAADPSRHEQRLDRIDLLLRMNASGTAPAGWAAVVQGDLDTLDGELVGRDGLRRRRLALARRFYREQQDWVRLTRTLESMLRQQPEDVALLIELGGAAEAQRQRSVALRYYRRALRIDPTNAAANARVADLNR